MDDSGIPCRAVLSRHSFFLMPLQSPLRGLAVTATAETDPTGRPGPRAGVQKSVLFTLVKAGPLPESWPKRIKGTVLHIISLAHWSIVYTRSMCANSPLERVSRGHCCSY